VRQWIAAAAAALAVLVLPASAVARKPVVAYADSSSGAFSIHDLETGTALPVPPLAFAANNSSFFFRRVNVSTSGRWVVYRAGAKIHLVDRSTNLDLPLPGIDVEAAPAYLSVSDDGRYIAFDANGEPPTHVYDRTLGRLLLNPGETGIPVWTDINTNLPVPTGGDMRQPQFSGDGLFIAGTRFGCQAGGADSDLCLDRFPAPGMLTVANTSDSEEHPCIGRDGSFLGFHAAVGGTVHLLDRRTTSAGTEVALPGVNGAGVEADCWLAPAGDYIGFTTQTGFDVYDRAAGARLPHGGAPAPGVIPPAVQWGPLSDPFSPASARRPIVAYLAPAGQLRLYDTEAAQQLDPPPVTVPASPIVRLFAMSQDGRWVAWRDALKRLHLFDRQSGAEAALAGIDIFQATSSPGSLTVSDGPAPRIAFDNNGNPPAVAYDVATQAFIDIGMDAGMSGASATNSHRGPRLSGDGRRLATICSNSCVVNQDADGDDDVFLQDLTTRQPIAIPDNLTGAGAVDEQRPCLSGNGTLIGMDAPFGAQRDLVLFAPAGGGRGLFPATVNAAGTSESACRLDGSGQYEGFSNLQSGEFSLYDRLRNALVPLPAGEASDQVWLTAPYPPEAPPATDPGPASGGDQPPGGAGTGAPGAGTPPPGAAALDRTPPKLKLTVKARQRILRTKGIVAIAGCNERCSLSVTGVVTAGRKRLTLRPAARRPATGAFRAKLAVPKRGLKKLRQMLRAKGGAKVSLRALATDAAGNRTTARRTVRIR
jgi:hypothetical protein